MTNASLPRLTVSASARRRVVLLAGVFLLVWAWPGVDARGENATRTLTLSEGENWVSLFLPENGGTAAQVLGTDRLPAGEDLFTATRVEWYVPGSGGASVKLIWLDQAAGWQSGEGESANDSELPRDTAFNILIPPGKGGVELKVAEGIPARVSKDNCLQVTARGGGNYTVVNYHLPYGVALKDSGLREAGFTGAGEGEKVNPETSDELRLLKKETGSQAAPQTRILMDAGGRFVYWTGGPAIAEDDEPSLESAEDRELRLDETLVIYTRRSKNDLRWSIPLPGPYVTGE